MDAAHFSYMSPLGYQTNTCGYCKSKPKETSVNFYAHSSRKVHPRHYEGLVNRGWRRSGTTYYKPDVRHACCPHYTIRLNAAEFKPARDQRSAVNKFNDHVLGVEYKRQTARLCPRTRQEKKIRREQFVLGDRVREAEYSKIQRPVDKKTGDSIEPAHKLEINLEPDDYTEEKYAVFEQYQRLVHKEPPSKISKRGFKSFLCSGLNQDIYANDGRSRKIGSYHMCYRLDGKLIAVGFLDLLPHCVSSVYLIYHDSVSDWAFGKLTAMQEIALAREEGYGYYYMGYYIHSCVKMRYKRKFHPTYMLDPETYEWNLLDKDLLQRLDRRSYISLARDRRLDIPIDGCDHENADSSTHSSEGHVSLFEIDMPGIMTKQQIQQNVEIADVKFSIGKDVYSLEHFGSWSLDDEDNSPLVAIAEFVACIGPDLSKEIVTMFMG